MYKASSQVGPYTLIRQLGRGAFGVVWLAEKRTSIATTRFALKLPSDEVVDLEAIRNEAAIWEKASGHPNVLPIIEADVIDNQIVIVSEFAPDGSLAEWIQGSTKRTTSYEQIFDLIDGILAGLEHLHSRRIIHRDLKPQNILLQSNTPRIADFGIARALKTDKSKTAPSGTPYYMAPEAFSGKRSELTDIWAAGVIFYELLTCKLPFSQADAPSLMYAILTQRPDPLPVSVPGLFEQVILKALEKEPTQRYQSARQMRADVRSARSAFERHTVDNPERHAAYNHKDTLTVPLPTVPPIGSIETQPNETTHQVQEVSRRRKLPLPVVGAVALSLIIVIASIETFRRWKLFSPSTPTQKTTTLVEPSTGEPTNDIDEVIASIDNAPKQYITALRAKGIQNESDLPNAREAMLYGNALLLTGQPIEAKEALHKANEMMGDPSLRDHLKTESIILEAVAAIKTGNWQSSQNASVVLRTLSSQATEANEPESLRSLSSPEIPDSKFYTLTSVVDTVPRAAVKRLNSIAGERPLDSRNPRFLYLYGRALLLSDKPVEAVEALKATLAIVGDTRDVTALNVRVRIVLAAASLRTGNWQLTQTSGKQLDAVIQR